MLSDDTRLKQVLYNYLSNALKFTRDGGRVTIRALPEGAETMRVEVEDSGIGIPAADLGRLFVEFEQNPVDLGKFAAAFDQGLRAQNRVYREHRTEDVAILAPEVVALPKGSSQKFLKEMGATSVQHKFPLIVEGSRRDLLRSLARPQASP